MTDLEDAFGEDFAQGVKNTIQEKRRERNRLTEEQVAEIASNAINENRFDSENPRFQYTTDNGITHNVLLMQVPEMENRTVWEFLDEPWEGAASLPLDYLGEWKRCTFPDKELVKELETGEWYIVIGGIDIYTTDDGEERETIYPVRGLVSLDEAKQYADAGLEDEGFGTQEEDETSETETSQDTPEPEETDTSEEDVAEALGGDDEDEEEESEDVDPSEFEPEPDEAEEVTEEEDESDEEEGSIFGGVGDDDEEEETEEVSYDNVQAEVADLAEREPAVWEVEEGDERLGRLTEVVARKLEIEDEDAVQSVIIEVLNDYREDDEEEEEETGKDKLF